VLFVSLAFLSAAGFLGLHALATPKVLLDTPNAGFTLATPVGVALASVFAFLSSLTVSGIALGRRLRVALLVLMALWALASVLRLWPLHGRAVPEVADGILAALAIPTILLYGVAAARYRLPPRWRTCRSATALASASASGTIRAVGGIHPSSRARS